MQKQKRLFNIVYFIIIGVVFLSYVSYNWVHTINENINIEMRIAKSIGSAISKSDLEMLDATPQDISKPQYQALKKLLQGIIRVNPKARFAYVFREKQGKIFFVADSEPVESKDYSPPGQEYTETTIEDKEPFIDGDCHITSPKRDRWGQWITIYVPLKDETTNKIVAVFGMDYDAKFWEGHIIIQIVNASLLMAFLLVFMVFLKIFSNYKFLKGDNNELRAAQVALMESEEKYRVIAQSTLDVIFIVDKFGKQLFFNESIEKVLGYRVDELIGKPFTQFVPRSELPKYFSQLNNVFLNKEIRNFKTQIYHNDGHLVDVEINGKLISQNGKLVAQGTIVDITDRLKSEQEIKSKNEKLARLNAEKDKLFSIIAHDLRSPFNSFLGMTELIADESAGLSNEEIKHYLRDMNKTAMNVYRLIENLLNWAQVQQGLIKFVPERIQLCPVVESIIELISESVNKKMITVSNQIPESIEIFADKNMLQIILRNIISNSVKFTPRYGEIRISAKEKANQSIEISISDSGIGMNSTQISNLFQADVQKTRIGTEGEPSTGLGLMLCKEFTEKHGGQIWVESRVNKGSTFYLLFPFCNSAIDQQSPS